MQWIRFAPGLAQFRGYRRSWLRGDALAGITVAAYLVPQVMAYATVAGLPPAAGLWAVIGPMAVYSVFGSSRQLSVGPESTTALLTAVSIAPLAAADPQRYAALAAALALIVGALCLLARLVRLGFLANLLSYPVLVGYLAGIAVIMIASQLGKVTGVEVSGEEFYAMMVSFARNVGGTHWPTLALAVSVLVVLELFRRLAPKWPGPLIGMLGAALVTAVFALQDRGIAVVGSIPPGLPIPGFPEVVPQDLAILVLPAIGITIVAFSDNMLTARSFASRKDETIDGNAELGGLSAANFSAGLMQGFPVSCSASRTAIGDAIGSRTQMYSLVALGAVLVTLLLAGGVLAAFPMAALGAMVIYAAMRLVDVAGFRRIGAFRASELVIAAVTTVAVLGIGVLYGVLAAIGLSILDLLRRVAHPHDAVLGIVPGLAGMHDVDDYPGAAVEPGLLIYRYDAPLCFANAEDFRHRALAAVSTAATPVRWFVLNAEANVEVDLTALDILEQLRTSLADRGVVFGMARVKQDLRESLAAAGLLEKVGEEMIFPTLPTALAAYRAAPGS